jgi:hypothetical protein
MPATVRELGDFAEALDITAVQLLEVLGPRPWPPAGYILAHGREDVWTGTETVNPRWTITPVWNSTTKTHSLELMLSVNHPQAYAQMSAASAVQLSFDLMAAAQAIAATEN